MGALGVGEKDVLGLDDGTIARGRWKREGDHFVRPAECADKSAAQPSHQSPRKAGERAGALGGFIHPLGNFHPSGHDIRGTPDQFGPCSPSVEAHLA